MVIDENTIMSAQKVIYYDNNATTFMPKEVKTIMNCWMNRGNPSSNYKSAKEAQEMMNKFRLYIASLCGIKLEGPEGFSIIFTSGASESNSTMILSGALAYKKKTGKTPHIITSEVEHSSVLLCCENLESSGVIELTKIGPRGWTVHPEDVGAAIKPNTALVTIMAVNNETGIQNDIHALGALCHAKDIPFYTDAVQLFPKYPVQPGDDIDAFSISFHKLHGPIGCGILVIRDSLITGYSLGAAIAGTQNYGLRGGTENAPAILGSFGALRVTYKNREAKNKMLQQMMMRLLEKLGAVMPVVYMEDFDEKMTKPGSIVLIRPKDARIVVPGVILLAVFRDKFCNKAAISFLEKAGVIVSVGSACHTDDSESSHVVIAHKVPAILQDKVLRISLGDGNSESEIPLFIKRFKTVVMSDKVIVDKTQK